MNKNIERVDPDIVRPILQEAGIVQNQEDDYRIDFERNLPDTLPEGQRNAILREWNEVLRGMWETV